jgi:hypothetical protein
MSLSNYEENRLLDYETSTVLWAGLSTADPLDDASGLAEPSGNAYARVEVPSSYWNAASGGSLTNATAISFPRATGSWGTLTHFALFDAATSGNMKRHGTLDASLAVTSGIRPVFAVDALTLVLG